VRAGNGPALLECHIARLRPHYEGDPRMSVADGDPLTHSEQALIALGAEEEELAMQREHWLAAARGLLDEALNEPAPDPDGDLALVFARPRGTR
jgi:pyruvate dehydrogenase E1 component alpha subunit